MKKLLTLLFAASMLLGVAVAQEAGSTAAPETTHKMTKAEKKEAKKAKKANKKAAKKAKKEAKSSSQK
jgi:Ni/Co efflux regulator RcnB